MARGAFRGIIGALAMLAWGCTPRSDPRVPQGYPRDYSALLEMADRERALVIWSAIDAKKAAALLADFRAAHPRLRISYIEMSARDLNDRFLAMVQHGGAVPDILWSSAMDLQIKLVNDGFAQRYVSPEATHLPFWANWKDEAWGVTAEPIVLIYNRALLADAAAPHTHAALLALLERRRFPTTTYDATVSAVGYLYLSQDAQAWSDFWRLARAMAASGAALHDRAEDMVTAVERGKATMAYDVVGSYALGEAERDPQIGLVVFQDYTLMMSRIALIAHQSRHPAAARLFIDYLLSTAGQCHLVRQNIPSVRSDVPPIPRLQPAGLPLRAIRVGPGLLVISDTLTRRYFLRRWMAAQGTVDGG